MEPISLKTHHETPEQVTAVVEDLKSFITMPEPMLEPVAKQEPEPQEEPVSEALPVEEPQPKSQPMEEIRIEPIPESIPEPVLESITEQVSEPVAEVAPEPVAEVVPEQISVSAPKKNRKVLWACVAVLSVIALMFLGLAVLGRVCPDVVDPLLYSPEDLKIVRML